MQNSILVIFNTTQLGGAERSVIEQFKYVPASNIQYLVPKINTIDENVLEQELKQKAITVKYPHFLYRLNKNSTKLQLLFAIFFSAFSFLQTLFDLKKAKVTSYSVLYANGAKSAYLFFIYSLLLGFKGYFIWHVRDYPKSKLLNKLFHYLLSFKRQFKFVFISNSYSVQEQVNNEFTKHDKSIVLYNLSGLAPSKLKQRKIETIGVVAMSAPWKGIHQVIIWCSLFEEELKRLGIKKVNIYGSQIYKTKSDHDGYSRELKLLLDKFPSKIIRFMGLRPNKEIFAGIDLLLHTSIEKEPFGRVIIEAFKYRVPVISTALGGASELIQDSVTGFKFYPYHYTQLNRFIKIYQDDDRLREKVCENAFNRSVSIEENVIKRLKNFWSLIKVDS